MAYSESDVAKWLRNNPELVVEGDLNQKGSAAQPQEPKAKRQTPEHDLQVAVIAECDKRAATDPRWGLIFAIPNGGHRNPIVAAKLKAEGVRKGVLDLMIPVARHGYHGLFIELKAEDNKPTQEQLDWIRSLRAQGYRCEVIWDDFHEVIQRIEWYLGDDVTVASAPNPA
ncbi:MAG: VRR-NUC domain-containing protein [Caldilineaceae bacterium]|nr:VRR-NUC domain-containing protein [Caldilineaceae bacterium]